MFRKLLLLFILVPLAEFYLFWTLGDKIGLLSTFAIIFITAIIGASLTKSQGDRAIKKLQHATGKGTLPTQEALDGIIIIIAGTVLITPGFLTDAVGFLLLIPTNRTLIAKYLGRKLKNKIRSKPSSPAPPDPKQSQLDDGKVIDI